MKQLMTQCKASGLYYDLLHEGATPDEINDHLNELYPCTIDAILGVNW